MLLQSASGEPRAVDPPLLGDTSFPRTRWGGPSTAQVSHCHQGTPVAGQTGNRLMGKHLEGSIPEPGMSSPHEQRLQPRQTSAPPSQGRGIETHLRLALRARASKQSWFLPQGHPKAAKDVLEEIPLCFSSFQSKLTWFYLCHLLPHPKLPSGAFAVVLRAGITQDEGGTTRASHSPRAHAPVKSPGWDVWGWLEILHIYLTHPPKQLLA